MQWLARCAVLLVCCFALGGQVSAQITDDRYPGAGNYMTGQPWASKAAERRTRNKVRRDFRKTLWQGFRAEIGRASGRGVVAPLAAKAREIEIACGSRVISAVRYTRIAGTGGRLSLHASGRAIDIAGNPSCIYAHLRGWPGGVSTDYGRVKHVHFSYAPGGPEWGVRFQHYRGHRHKRRR